MKLTILAAAAALLSFSVHAQTQIPPLGRISVQDLPAGPSYPLYQYFAETGASGNRASGLSSTTGFGLRIGNSNAFWVTDVDTSIKSGGSVSTLRSGAEFHVAVSGAFEFMGFAAAGVSVDNTQASGAVGLGNFSGGFGVSYDVGTKITQGRLSLPVVAQFRLTAVTATSVTPIYSLMFRKTF